ncbi:MAG: hypothetical protein M3O41_12455 [Pseudomonadota bacterium]|nr:hypothetical protein [Pseudomonadota bacterium]
MGEADDRTEAPDEFVVDEELDTDDQADRRRVGIVEALGSDRPPGNADAVESPSGLAYVDNDLDAADGIEVNDSLEADDDDRDDHDELDADFDNENEIEEQP